MAKIFINNLKVKALIGTKEEERLNPQTLIINIMLEYNSEEAIATDGLSQALDYEKITQEITDKVEKSTFQLLETLCASLIKVVMNNPLISQTAVRIDKPSALPNADFVTIEMAEKREE